MNSRWLWCMATIGVIAHCGWAGESDLIPGMGDQWPDFRGPLGNFQPSSSTVPLSGDLKDLRQVWVSEKDVPGPAHQCHKLHENMMGSPIVAEGKVYVLYFHPTGNEIDESSIEDWKQAARGQTYDPANPPGYVRILAQDYLLAMDLKTGKAVWETKLPRMGQNWRNLNMGSRHQLVYGDGRLYAMGSSGALYGVAAEDGKIVWESALSSDVDALFAACMSEAKKTGLRNAYKILQHATTPLAAYADGVIAFGFMSRAKSGYWGLDAATGKHLWHDPGLVTGVASELMAFAPGGAKPVFIGVRRQGRGSQVVALEAKSGKELWKVPTQGSVCWLARQGHDIVASGDGYLAAIGTAGSAVSVRWEQECPVRTHYARPMIVGDRVVVAENSTGLVIYDLGKGNELYRDATKGAGCLGDYVQPIAADGRLYAFGGVRELDISKGCPFNKSEVAVTAKAFDPSPVRYMWPLIVDGRLIAHCSTRIACWDLRQSTTIGKETK